MKTTENSKGRQTTPTHAGTPQSRLCTHWNRQAYRSPPLVEYIFLSVWMFYVCTWQSTGQKHVRLGRWVDTQGRARARASTCRATPVRILSVSLCTSVHLHACVYVRVYVCLCMYVRLSKAYVHWGRRACLSKYVLFRADASLAERPAWIRLAWRSSKKFAFCGWKESPRLLPRSLLWRARRGILRLLSPCHSNLRRA